ncbi:MAG: polysaccharide biosynthesis tyrosine autokinase [Oxalobacteraceae bacterium]
MNTPLATYTSTVTESPLIFSDRGDDHLSDYVSLLLEQRWLIISVALLVLLLGTLYAFVATPQYEANLLVHVEEKGQREPKNILGEAGSMIDYKTPTAAEVELLRSRRVVARAVDQLRLYVDAHPDRAPLVGSLLANSELAEVFPLLRGAGGYAWGRESIEIGDFSVPATLENRTFRLQALGHGRFRLTEPQSGLDTEGQVGQPLALRLPAGLVNLRVLGMQAWPGSSFVLERRSRLAVIESVQTALSVAEIGKQSGMISATLKGADADRVYQLMTQITREYMAQNSARRTEEADKSLAYLNQRLPELKQQLEQAEARYNQFRHVHGTVDLGEEGRLTLQRSSAARMRRVELEQRRSELLSRFTANHPAVVAVDEQIKDIDREMRESASQLKQLPVLEQEMVRLAREVKVNNELYSALLSSAQQLQLIAIGKTSNVRLVDAPEKPERPVTPNRPRIIAVAVFVGLCLGVMVAFLRRSLQTALQDPSEVERAFGVPVYASIPHSRLQQTLAARTGESVRLPLLARIASMDVAVESLRGFRSALQFCLTQSKNNLVLITGPTEALGKSFLTVNLACVMAYSGKRVLLIDGELRDGHLHRYFQVDRAFGLADLLAGARADNDFRHSVMEQLDFISTGNLPPNPSELLLRPELAALIARLAPHYDLVLIDTAPLLAVADSLILGAHAGAIFVAVRAGVTQAADIAESLKRLDRAGLSAKGLLFNDFTPRPGHYRYDYGQHARRQIGYSAPSPAEPAQGAIRA